MGKKKKKKLVTNFIKISVPDPSIQTGAWSYPSEKTEYLYKISWFSIMNDPDPGVQTGSWADLSKKPRNRLFRPDWDLNQQKKNRIRI